MTFLELGIIIDNVTQRAMGGANNGKSLSFGSLSGSTVFSKMTVSNR